MADWKSEQRRQQVIGYGQVSRPQILFNKIVNVILLQVIRLVPMYEKYGPYPRSGEILLMESRGNAKYKKDRHIGVEQVHSALRFSDIYEPKETNFYKNSPVKLGFNSIFHNYQLEWTPGILILTVSYFQMLLIM